MKMLKSLVLLMFLFFLTSCVTVFKENIKDCGEYIVFLLKPYETWGGVIDTPGYKKSEKGTEVHALIPIHCQSGVNVIYIIDTNDEDYLKVMNNEKTLTKLDSCKGEDNSGKLKVYQLYHKEFKRY